MTAVQPQPTTHSNNIEVAAVFMCVVDSLITTSASNTKLRDLVVTGPEASNSATPAAGGGLTDVTNRGATPAGVSQPIASATTDGATGGTPPPPAGGGNKFSAEFFPCLPEAKRRQLFEWFKREEAWCALMPTAIDVRVACANLPPTPQIPDNDYVTVLSTFVERTRLTGRRHKGTTVASGLSYFLRFLGTTAAAVNRSQGVQNATTAVDTPLKQTQTRVAPAGAQMPPIQRLMPVWDLTVMLDQAVHLAQSLYESEYSVEELHRNLTNEARIASAHRDYLVATLRYDLMAVTPYHFLNYLQDSGFNAQNELYAPVMQEATEILDNLMFTSLWMDYLPSSLAGVALYIGWFRALGRPVEEQHFPVVGLQLLQEATAVVEAPEN